MLPPPDAVGSPTVLTIPLTTNLRRATLPTCLLIPSGEGGLEDSVALCHQMRVLDEIRLRNKLGELKQEILTSLENTVLLTAFGCHRRHRQCIGGVPMTLGY